MTTTAATTTAVTTTAVITAAVSLDKSQATWDEIKKFGPTLAEGAPKGAIKWYGEVLLPTPSLKQGRQYEHFTVSATAEADGRVHATASPEHYTLFQGFTLPENMAANINWRAEYTTRLACGELLLPKDPVKYGRVSWDLGGCNGVVAPLPSQRRNMVGVGSWCFGYD